MNAMTITQEDPWADWKKNPAGNALALTAMLAYIGFVVVPVFVGVFS